MRLAVGGYLRTPRNLKELHLVARAQTNGFHGKVQKVCGGGGGPHRARRLCHQRLGPQLAIPPGCTHPEVVRKGRPLLERHRSPARDWLGEDVRLAEESSQRRTDEKLE